MTILSGPDALYHKMGIDDLEDVVKAGRYLKGLPFVDPDQVGVYGLSYGGYMTLHGGQHRGDLGLRPDGPDRQGLRQDGEGL